MTDSLEDMTNEEVDKSNIELGKDWFSKKAATITAVILLFDFIRVLYTQNCNGEAQSIFEFLHPIDNTNYKNLLYLEGLYTVFFTIKSKYN